MGQAEKTIQHNRFLNLKPIERLFRGNAGMGWTGKMTRLKNGDVLLKNARPFHGLPEGFPDMFGWESVTISEKMVGTTVALFVAEEIKAGKDRMRPAQTKFKKIIESMGGIYRIIRE